MLPFDISNSTGVFNNPIEFIVIEPSTTIRPSDSSSIGEIFDSTSGGNLANDHCQQIQDNN